MNAQQYALTVKQVNPPERRKIEVRANGSGMLFVYDPEIDSVEVKIGKQHFSINLYYLREFVRTSQRNIYVVYETDLPCGHAEGTKFDAGREVCVICSMPAS